MNSSSPLGFFERYLTVWVGIGITLGVLLGLLFPGAFQTISELSYASINFVIVLFIWLMIYPMMINVDISSIKDVGKKPKGLSITLITNWLIKPFSMAGLGVLFFEYLFAAYINPAEGKEIIAGMILLGVAPCTAMVFVWSQLVRGDANYTLVQVTLNDLIMAFAFAPIAAFLLNVTDIAVPWDTLVLSVLLYVVVPMFPGLITRKLLEGKKNPASLSSFTLKVKPFSILGLLATVILLFGFQAHTIINRPFIIFLIAIPLIIQSYGIFGLAYAWAYLWRVPFPTAAPAALISTSNFFELAVAVAISLFGLHSGTALATVVGVLVEVPVMLSLVAFANKNRAVYENRVMKP